VDIINPIQSARIRTINSFSFTYGTVEIRAKMPRGDWIWPGNNQFRRAITSNIIGTTEIESNPLKLGFISFPPS